MNFRQGATSEMYSVHFHSRNFSVGNELKLAALNYHWQKWGDVRTFLSVPVLCFL